MTYTTIAGYNEGGGWAFIASPLTEDKTPTTVNNMLSGANYDLYWFNQSATGEEWQNYKADNFSLVNGKGYLYANDVEVNVIFKGEFNEDEIKVVSLDYDTEKANAGWNLVGNPFPVCAYIDRPYYTSWTTVWQSWPRKTRRSPSVPTSRVVRPSSRVWVSFTSTSSSTA